ncbi:MAG: single-stranded DNA-binding protein [Candidatus Chloroheliales bacterium]|nr:MAG: single-stranded DNA-binding protein [Chloroflexota bacterium]
MAGRSLNKIMLIGNLGKDPEMRFTPNGQEQVRFTLACSRSWKTPEGETREETDWFNVTTFGNLGKICNEYLHKGSKVYIEGRLSMRQYDDAQTGQKKTWVEVFATDMMMLDSRQAGEGGGYSGAQRSNTAERSTSNQDTSAAPVFEEDMDDIPF